MVMLFLELARRTSHKMNADPSNDKIAVVQDKFTMDLALGKGV